MGILLELLRKIFNELASRINLKKIETKKLIVLFVGVLLALVFTYFISPYAARYSSSRLLSYIDTVDFRHHTKVSGNSDSSVVYRKKLYVFHAGFFSDAEMKFKHTTTGKIHLVNESKVGVVNVAWSLAPPNDHHDEELIVDLKIKKGFTRVDTVCYDYYYVNSYLKKSEQWVKTNIPCYTNEYKIVLVFPKDRTWKSYHYVIADSDGNEFSKGTVNNTSESEFLVLIVSDLEAGASLKLLFESGLDLI